MSKFAPYEPRPANLPTPKVPPAMGGLAIAPAAPRDIDAVARLTFEREGGSYDHVRERAERWLAASASADGSNLFLVARVDRFVAGYGRAGLVRGRNDHEYDVPEGWYLGGLVVDQAWRRRGIGRALTRHRLDQIIGRGVTEAYYFVNSINRASIDLHAAFGFVEIRRDFRFPGVNFSAGGTGVLFRATF